jgi:hypothetical protein
MKLGVTRKGSWWFYKKNKKKYRSVVLLLLVHKYILQTICKYQCWTSRRSIETCNRKTERKILRWILLTWLHFPKTSPTINLHNPLPFSLPFLNVHQLSNLLPLRSSFFFFITRDVVLTLIYFVGVLRKNTHP